MPLVDVAFVVMDPPLIRTLLSFSSITPLPYCPEVWMSTFFICKLPNDNITALL
ncbi:hypothetical protein SRABI106_01266 [Rahnella aquatilis]|nr:hypothetical protein SRABI106_01266 [Rahnella aquatilis]